MLTTVGRFFHKLRVL